MLLTQIAIFGLIGILPLALSKPPNNRIVGGKVGDIKKFPYQVSLQTWDVGRHHCGGSIIGDKWILTAAHCTLMTERPYYIRVGSTYHAEGGAIYNVTRVINHPKFDPSTFNYDIALLELESPITVATRANIITLPEEDKDIAPLAVVTVSGWGATLNTDEPNNALRFTHLPILEHGECSSRYKGRNEVTKNMICTAYPGGGRDACSGDSGGPLVFDEKLYGIVSWGDGCGDEGSPGVFTKVSALRKWIHENSGL